LKTHFVQYEILLHTLANNLCNTGLLQSDIFCRMKTELLMAVLAPTHRRAPIFVTEAGYKTVVVNTHNTRTVLAEWHGSPFSRNGSRIGSMVANTDVECTSLVSQNSERLKTVINLLKPSGNFTYYQV
jgi:hypothetical protein